MLSARELQEITDDLANLETALTNHGFGSARVTAILAASAGQVIANVTGALRMAGPVT